MVMGLVSRLSLANHFDSETFLVVHPWFSQDGCQREGFWEVVRQVVSPLDLSRTLLVGWGLLVPCSLPGPFVVKQLMQMVTVVPGQGGRFHGFNQRASPNKNTWVNFRKLVLSVSKFFCDLNAKKGQFNQILSKLKLCNQHEMSLREKKVFL